MIEFKWKQIRELEQLGYDIFDEAEFQAKFEEDQKKAIRVLGKVGGGFKTEDDLDSYLDEVGLIPFQEEVMEALNRDLPLAMTGRKKAEAEADPKE